MEKISYSYKLKSHPEKTLYTHFKNVRDLMLEIIEGKVLNAKVDKKEFTDLVKIIALTHDFGKSTKFFQKYINKQAKKSYKTNHSEISSLFSFYLSQKLDIKDVHLPFIITKSHHGSINSKELIKQDIFEEQLENIDFEELNSLYKELLSINVKFSEFKELIFNEDSDLYFDLEEEVYNLTNKQNDLKDFFLVLFLFSLLIDSDKLDAGINDREKIFAIKDKIKNFNCPDLVEKHKKEFIFEESKINQIRESIYNEVINKEINLENKIYSINVPTGTGKTLTSLSFACKLKDKLIKDKGFNPKIIYCLPFTSIIDQNYSVIEDILKNNGIENITTDILLKHHHLSDISYTTDNEEEFETSKSLLLIENWMSSIVVTTFIQFFHSIISNRNKSLKKFHNIANSIVILDEIQSVPYKYWKLINETLKTFSEIFNTYFVLVTATQPLIFKPDEIISVIANRQKYFENPELSRIKLISELEKITLEDFKPLVLGDINTHNDKSFLIILNTIKSSQEVYSFLKNEIDIRNTEILYLSTTILPFERQKIIEKVKKKEKRTVLVSTQVVEAGVDIDLDFVYRDLAPLDCIFQSAGRCNRNGNNDKGIVKIFKLLDENNRNTPYSKYVYSDVLLNTTKSLLEKKDIYEEKEFFSLAKAYYEELDPHRSANEKIISTDDGEKILESMKKLDFSGLKEFQLIEEKVESFDFFIELDDDAVKVRKEFESILKNNEYENKFDKKYDLLEKRRKLHKYIVSVRLKKGQEYEFETSTYKKFNGNPYYIPIEDIENFYQKDGIGFYIKENECMIL